MIELLIASALPELPALVRTAPTKQQAILERILAEAPANATERQFGDCNYGWSSWKLADGIRTSVRHCRGDSSPSPVAVSCSLLKITTSTVSADKKQEWEPWRSPVAPGAKPGEAMMVASLCANASQ